MKILTENKVILFLLGFFFLLLTACNPAGSGSEPGIDRTGDGEEVTMYVGPETTECVGEAIQTCLLIKFEPAAEWELFYDSIEGFEYEPGFEYQLLVDKYEVDNPPADASSIRYELKEIVHKVAIESGQPDLGEPIPTESLGGKWNLISYGPEGEETAVLADTAITADFTTNTISGSAGCNSYNGNYFMNANLITIDQIITTLIGCSEEISTQESAYLGLLAAAESVTQTPGQLIIHAPDGNLIFEPAEHSELESGEWRLSGILQDNAVVSMVIDESINLTFADGTLNGFSGCNSFFSDYTIDGQSLDLGPIGRTEIACAEEVMSREMALFSTLERVEGYEIERNSLTLLDTDGVGILFFTK